MIVPARVSCLFLVSFLVSSTAAAQCPLLEVRGGPGAVDGGHAIVGGWGQPPRVDFYSKSASGWQRGPSAVIGDARYIFPLAVSIDGNRAVAGAPEASDAFYIQGRAFVFERSGTAWSAHELVPSLLYDKSFFGMTVAIRGDVVAVGAMGPPERTHVFERSGGAWTETAVLRTFGGIAIDGDVLVVGTPNHPPHIDVYRRVAGAWTRTQILTGRDSLNSPYYGSSFALRDGLLAVGAAWPYADASAYVEIRRDVAGTFVPVQYIVPEVSDPTDGWGSSVALSGSTLLVGAPGNDVHAPGGAVYRYRYDGSLFHSEGALAVDPPGPIFGSGVSVDGEDAIVGGLNRCTFLRLGFEHADAFCPTTPNSTGAGGSLTVEGCDSLSGAHLTLAGSQLPPGVLVRGIFGASATQVPYGDGFRCVGSPLFRLPWSETDAAGGFAIEVDFASGPASRVTAGHNWNFQVVHRDHIGTGLNLTNALAVGITP